MESKNNRPDNGISEQAELNQGITYLKSGKAGETWKGRFDAYVDYEIRNGHSGAMREMLWEAMLELSKDWIFLSDLSSEERVEKIDRLIKLLSEMEPPADWLFEFGEVFTGKRRREEKDGSVQGMLFDLAAVAEWRAIPKTNSISRPRKFDEHAYQRSVESGTWRTPDQERRDRQRNVPYPLQPDRKVKRRS